MKPPRIYAAMIAVSRDLAKAGVAKTQLNQDEGYAFRGIDDVMQAVAPLLHKRRICVLPRLTERTVSQTSEGSHVTVRGAFDFVAAADGSHHTVETFGEAADRSDKATSKAMSAAYKYALIQAFCIPVRGLPDADATTPTLVRAAEPVQGWGRRSCDIISLIEGCESREAITRVQETYASEFRALASARQPEYPLIGKVIRIRKSLFLKIVSSDLRGVERGGDAHASEA